MIFSLLGLLFYFFEKAVILFFLNDYLSRFYPKIHNEIIISFAYNTIYVYSYCQIKCKKCLSYVEKNCPLFLKNYLIKLLENSENNISTIEFIKDNKLVYFSTKSILKEINFEVPDYDFIVYRDNKTIPTNIKYISYKSKDELTNEDIYKYEKSNMKFMVVEFCVNDKIYLIDLSNDKYNFYIKDNIFDKQFFIYYLRYFYNNKNELDNTENIDINFDDTDEITLRLIDHNVDIKKIEFTKDSKLCIRIDKDNYEISSKL
jgi:hypothetical protein